MYSVLIQNQKTMELFEKYHPLFLHALNEEKIGVCQWFESGTNIETAVPELYNRVSAKEEWRALIVRLEDEAPMSAFETCPDNPYDFLENLSEDTRMRESNIPLIRLTHMLGGLPSPNVAFDSEIVREENKTPRMVYVPTVSEGDKEEYERLSEKYHFEGTPPSEIILVSLAYKKETRVENVSSVWAHHKEIESSEFWKRNGYPSICRFCFYEMQRQGPVQEMADLFNVWSCVLLLATNNIEPSTLQAYKLHRLQVEIDRDKMTENVEVTAGKVISAIDYITKSIQRELAQRINEKTVMPDYALTVPVVVDLPGKKDFGINTEEFKLTSRTATADVENWSARSKIAQQAVKDSQISAERALDRSADRMREYCSYSPEEIIALDAYQVEDLNASLRELREKFFERRTEFSEKNEKVLDKREELEESITERLISRLTRRQAVLTAIVCMLGSLLTLIPGVVLLSTERMGSWTGIAVAAMLCIAGPVAMLLVLLFQRSKLRNELTEYNSTVSALVLRVAENSERYSEYLSILASYAHGKSYLDELGKKHFLKDESLYHKRRHIAALNVFLADLKEWTIAFHLPINVESADIQEDLSLDTGIAPYVNPLYTFDNVGSWPVDVNSSGDVIESPFAFINKIRIEREELYDDAR